MHSRVPLQQYRTAWTALCAVKYDLYDNVVDMLDAGVRDAVRRGVGRGVGKRVGVLYVGVPPAFCGTFGKFKNRKTSNG